MSETRNLSLAEKVEGLTEAQRRGQPAKMPERIWANPGQSGFHYGLWGLDASDGTEFLRADLAAERATLLTPGDARAYGIIDPDYARVFTIARTIAWQEGYALMMHGSFTRDLDLLAVPWTDHTCEADHLIARIADATGLRPNGHPPGKKPHGRLAWTLLFPAFGDPRFVDIGVMPAFLRAKGEQNG